MNNMEKVPKRLPPEEVDPIRQKEKVETTGEETPETSEPHIEQPEAPVESQEDLEQVFIDPEKELQDINSQMQMNSEKIKALKQAMEKDGEKLNKVREGLGMPPVEAGGENKELHALEEEQKRLEAQQENVRAEKDLENVLKLLGALPKSELKIIIETGKTTDGKMLKTPDGKEVNPDVAKKLAEAAESGATKLTKALLGVVLGLAKGILKGIFQVIAGAGSRSGNGAEKVG